MGDKEDLNSSQLYYVFKECDKNCDGYLSLDDIKKACDSLGATEREEVLRILDIGPDDRLDYTCFKLKVGRYLESKPESPCSWRCSTKSPDSSDTSPLGRYGTDTPVSRSPISEILRKSSGYFGSKEFQRIRDDGCVSPFNPILNSSELLSGSYTKIQAQKRMSCDPVDVVSGSAKSTPGTTFQGSGEESSVGFIKRSRGSFRTRVRKRKARRDGMHSGASSSTSSSFSSRTDIDIYELADKMEEVRESTVQAKQEISSLFQHFITKEKKNGSTSKANQSRNSESEEDSLFQTERRRRIDELVSLETQLIKLKMEGQAIELDKLKTENTDVLAKYYQLLKEKDKAAEEMRNLKENCTVFEQNIHRTSREKAELNCQLEDLRNENRSLEEHIDHLEEKRKLQLEEIKEIKEYLNQERGMLNEDKAFLTQEKDKYRRLLNELNTEREELMAEKKNLDVELDRFRMEQEKFMLKFNNSRRNEESFVMIDAYGELDSIITENKILRNNLNQIASEKTDMENELRRLQTCLQAAEAARPDNEAAMAVRPGREAAEAVRPEREEESRVSLSSSSDKSRVSLSTSSDKSRVSLSTSSDKSDVIKEKERVISSLMDVVEDLKKDHKSTKSIREHEKNLRELVQRMSVSAARLDSILSSRESRRSKFNRSTVNMSTLEEKPDNVTVGKEALEETLDAQLAELQRRIECLEQKKNNFLFNPLTFRKVKG